MVRISDTLKQQNDLTSFPVAFGDSIWLNKDKSGATEDYSDLQTMYNNDLLGSGGSSIQVDTMPIASEYPNEIVQYVGESGTYQNGYFYQSTSDEQNPPTYSWVQKNVQPNSVTLTQEEYEALTEEEKLDGLYYTYDTKRIYKNGVQYGASDAEDIGYNNAESGIQATTVQGAIDKVVKTVEDDYAKKTDIPTSLPANGGNADTVNNHTVKSDVPENAVFTDTIYDDTEVKGSIEELNEVIRSYFYPTGVITDIEIGENGAKYIAPSDGFVQVTVNSVVSGIGYASIITSNPANSVSLSEPSGNNQRVKTFVKKGEEYSVYYSIGDNGLITLKHYALV